MSETWEWSKWAKVLIVTTPRIDSQTATAKWVYERNDPLYLVRKQTGRRKYEYSVFNQDTYEVVAGPFTSLKAAQVAFLMETV